MPKGLYKSVSNRLTLDVKCPSRAGIRRHDRDMETASVIRWRVSGSKFQEIGQSHPFLFTVHLHHKSCSFTRFENFRRQKESRTNPWYWFSTMHWLEFKFKVENYSPWGRRNLPMGGANTQSLRIRVFTVHWWFLSGIRITAVISGRFASSSLFLEF